MVIDPIPHILDKSIAGLIILIYPGPKALDAETKPPIIEPWAELINIVKSKNVISFLIIIIETEIVVILFLIETEDQAHTIVIEAKLKMTR